MSERLAQFRTRMAEVGLDGFLVSAPVEDMFHTYAANRRYLSGFTGSTGWLLITPAQRVQVRPVDQKDPHLPLFQRL